MLRYFGYLSNITIALLEIDSPVVLELDLYSCWPADFDPFDMYDMVERCPESRWSKE